jgi:hypothetical protein
LYRKAFPPELDVQSATLVRWLAQFAFFGIVVFTAAMLALHWLQPSLSPLHEAMSYYVHGRHGWLTTLGLIALGAGSLSITIALAVQGKHRFLGMSFLFAWSVGAILGGIFSADPPGNWDQPPSISGAIALTAFPAATILLLRSFHNDKRWQRMYRALNLLTSVVFLSYIAFIASLAPVFVRPGPPVLLGLTERVLFAANVAWLTVVAVGLLRLGDTATHMIFSER